MVELCYRRRMRGMQGFVKLRRQCMCLPGTPSIAILGILLAVLLSPASAQVAEGLCACTPRVYQMTVNLAQTCEATGNFGAGVFLTDCSVFPLDNQQEVTDLVPQEIVTVDIVELGQNLATPVGQIRLEGSYGTGDTFEYLSNTAVPEDLNDQNVPKALQITLTGNNANRDIIVMNALVAFSNECDKYPILLDGAATGWVGLIEAQAPDLSVCPAATMPIAPQSSTTSQPTVSAAPSSSPSGALTAPTTALPSTISPSTSIPNNLEPGTAPPTLRPTKKPHPSPPSCDCSKEKGKGKGKGKGKDASKSAKSSKSSKSSKSKSGSKSSKESRERNNYLDIYNDIFRDRYYQSDDCDCSSASSGSSQSSGKGKGKGYYSYYDTPSPTSTAFERTTTAAPSTVAPEDTLPPTSSASPTIINSTIVPTPPTPSEGPSDAPSTAPIVSPDDAVTTTAPTSPQEKPTGPPGDDVLLEPPPTEARSTETADTASSGGLLTAVAIGGSIMTVTLLGLLGWNYWENQRERHQQELTGRKIPVQVPTSGNDEAESLSESETSNLTMASQK